MRQLEDRSTIDAGLQLKAEEFRYLRTVRITLHNPIRFLCHLLPFNHIKHITTLQEEIKSSS